MSSKNDKWRRNARLGIEKHAVAARQAIAQTKTLALSKSRMKITDTIGEPLPQQVAVTLDDEIELVGAALNWQQQAENEMSALRTELQRYLGRLHSARETEQAYGHLTVVDFTVKKPKRPARKEMRAVIHEAWQRYLEENGQPVSKWGLRLAHQRVGAEMNLSGDTVRRYLKEAM